MPEYTIINKNVNITDDFFLYPYYIFRVNVIFKRPFMKPKKIEKIMYVDLFREVALMGKEFPQLIKITTTLGRVIPSIISLERAESLAITASEDWARKTKMIWSVPQVEIIDKIQAYRIYYIKKEKKGEYILDSLTLTKKKLK